MTGNPLFTEDVREWLGRVVSRKDNGVNHSLRNIETGAGNPHACKLDLESGAEVRAIWAYYAESNLQQFKQWMYVAAKLQLDIFPLECGHGHPLWLWHALLSDNETVIRHISHFPEQYPEGYTDAITAFRKHQLKAGHLDHQFYVRQLAIRGEWALVRAEALKVLESPSKSIRQYVLTDMKFLLALADGDVGAMEACLLELLVPKIRKLRNDWPFVEELLSVDALVLAKIAWRHGFEVVVDTPYIPQEWLPVRPNASYVDPYDFMAKIVLA